jgi:integrase
MRTSTGLISNSNVWSDKTDLPTLGKNASDKNLVTKLQNLSTFVLEAYNVDFANGVNFSNEWLKSKINKYFERENPITEKEDDNFFSVYLKNNIELRKLDSRTKKTTDQKFVQLQTKFTDFEKTKKKKYLISEIDKKFMLVFRKHLIDKFKIMESTANRSLKNLKTVLIDARDNGKTINHQINNFSIDTVPATKVFLNFDEIKKIKESTIIGSDLIHAKDWLIIGCYTGQRVSDLLRMTKEMVFTKTDSNGESFQFIELTQQKTGKEVTIPLHDEVLKIINKYDGNFPPTFGKTGDSKFALFNRYIKKVCEISKINDIVKGKVYDSKEKRNEIK